MTLIVKFFGLKIAYFFYKRGDIMNLTNAINDLAKTTKHSVLSMVPIYASKKDIRLALRKDHETILGILEDLVRRTENQEEGLLDLAQSLRSVWSQHIKAEEQVLYEACRQYSQDLRAFALEGAHEHLLVDEMISKLLQCEPGPDGKFRAALMVTKDLIEHHLRAEEGSLFVKLKNHFGEVALIKMGEKFVRLKKEAYSSNGAPVSKVAPAS